MVADRIEESASSHTISYGRGWSLLRVAASVVGAIVYLVGSGMRKEVDDAAAVWIGNAFVALGAVIVFLVWFVLVRSRLRRPFKYSNRAIVAVLIIASAFVLWGALALLFSTYNDPAMGTIAKELLARRYGNAFLPVVWSLVVGAAALATATAIAARADWAVPASVVVGWVLVLTGTPILGVAGFLLWWWWLEQRSSIAIPRAAGAVS